MGGFHNEPLRVHEKPSWQRRNRGKRRKTDEEEEEEEEEEGLPLHLRASVFAILFQAKSLKGE